MTSDDWLKNGLPVYHGGKDISTARQMLTRMGGPVGFKTDYRTSADGSVTRVQCKGDSPPQITTTRIGGVAYEFRYSFSINVGFTTSYQGLQTPWPASSLSPYVVHDNFIDVWWRAKGSKTFLRASKAPVRNALVPLWSPSGDANYINFPPSTVNGFTYVGNKYHGRISRTGSEALLSIPLQTPVVISSEATSPPIEDPDTDLVVLNPVPLNLTVSGGELTNYAIVSTHNRVYDYVNGVMWGPNTSVYDVADGTRFSIRTDSTSTTKPMNEATSVTVSVFARRTAPIEKGSVRSEEVSIGVFQCTSPAAGDTTDSAWCLAFCRPSPSGKKLCLSVVRAKKMSDDIRNSHYLSAVYEVVLSGGSASDYPSAAISFVDSTDNDISTTEYVPVETRLPKKVSHISDVDVVVSNTVVGSEGRRLMRRTTTWSNEQWPRFTVNPISHAKRSQLALAGYTTATGDVDTLNVVRVEAEANYTYHGYADATTITGVAEWADYFFIDSWGEFYFPHRSETVKEYENFTTSYRYLGNLVDYPYDVSGSVTIRVLVNGVSRFSETHSGSILAGEYTYTAAPRFSNYEGWVDPPIISHVDTPPAHLGDFNEVFPQVMGTPWVNLVDGYASNNTVMWTTGFPPNNSSRALITLNGDLMNIFVPRDDALLYWASYNPVTKQVDTQPYRVWI